MRIDRIDTHSLFNKHYKRLPKRIKEVAKIKELIFRENPYHPALRTYKLHGEEKEVWSFWIVQAYRIKFIFIAESSVLFLDVGTHDIYQ